MNLLATVSSLAPLLAVFFSLHPIHVSVTEIEYDEKDRALEIMMRVFVDDLELTLRESFSDPALDVLDPANNKRVDELVAKYLADHFKITLDNKPQQAHYLGREREGEAFIFYVEVRNVSKWNTITVRNEVIMGTYDDQSNIIHVYVNDQVRSARLTPRSPAEQLSFD